MSDEINKSVPSGTERCPKCMSPDKQRTFSKCRPRENEHAWHGHDQPTPAAQPDEYDKATIRKCCCEPGSPCKAHGVSAEATKPQQWGTERGKYSPLFCSLMNKIDPRVHCDELLVPLGSAIRIRP
jgi:hypothetical protein